VRVGDELLVDGGMAQFEVIEKLGPDVKCRCTDPGLLLPRANLTFWRGGSIVREKNAMLPTISSKVNLLACQMCCSLKRLHDTPLVQLLHWIHSYFFKGCQHQFTSTCIIYSETE
jgi:hypothetical protein